MASDSAQRAFFAGDQPEGPLRDNQAKAKALGAVSDPRRTGVGGQYHQPNRRMVIAVDGFEAGASQANKLFCHYDPTEMTETFSATWSDSPISGESIQPIVFNYAHPREWSMKLLFITLGEEASRQAPGVITPDEAISMLRSFMMPKSYGGLGNRAFTSTDVNSQTPPTLLVFLLNQAFRCKLVAMTVVRKAIHPQLRVTTKAEVDVTFREYVESSVPS